MGVAIVAIVFGTLYLSLKTVMDARGARYRGRLEALEARVAQLEGGAPVEDLRERVEVLEQIVVSGDQDLARSIERVEAARLGSKR